MYKKQLVFQKIVCLLAVIAAAISFVYSLGILTDLYDSLYPTMMNPDDLTQTYVPGSIIYYDMQEFNAQLVNASIGLVLCSCLLFLTNTHVRRKYYVGNYIAAVIYCAATVAVAVWAHIEISAYKVQYLTTVDFEALKAFCEMLNRPYIESTFWLDLHYFTAAVAALSVVTLLINMVWKIVLMRSEKKLIAEGKGAAV